MGVMAMKKLTDADANARAALRRAIKRSRKLTKAEVTSLDFGPDFYRSAKRVKAMKTIRSLFKASVKLAKHIEGPNFDEEGVSPKVLRDVRKARDRERHGRRRSERR